MSSKQALRLKLKKGTRISPILEKCCLLLVSNESFANAETDLEMLTGIKVAHSTQHRLALKYQVPLPQVKTRVETLSVDGGSVRLRTPLGQSSEWKQYKALKVHEQVGMALFQDDQQLINWINQQPLCPTINCLGDGHDGVWKFTQNIANPAQRREILDWYHLTENIYRVGGSIKRLHRIKYYLWQGSIPEALDVVAEVKSKQADNFSNYLLKHQSRIPDYQLYQELGITIGSGGVESLIKQIDSRIQIVGAQWHQHNVSQMLRLRCAYLNGDIKLGISA